MSTDSMLLRPLRACFAGLVRIANSAKATVLAFLLLVVVSGVLYSFFEERNVGDSIWWAVVTASTVGYGDISPSTVAGRVVAGVLISAMVLLVIPLITAHFASKLIVDQDAFKHDEQEEIKQNLRRIRELLEGTDGAERVSAPDSSSRPAARAGQPDTR